MDAVFFDMDGLLVDTEKVWYDVESEVAERLGGIWGPDHQEELVGGSLPATVAYMLRVTGADVPPSRVAEWMLEGMTRRLAEGRAELMPGAADLLAEVRAAEVPMGLVTSSAKVITDLVLAAIGRECFDVVITGDDVVRTKPHP
ncbi:MAG TPA: HAD family phosphatase, partial [Thermopolyspora sp.]